VSEWWKAKKFLVFVQKRALFSLHVVFPLLNLSFSIPSVDLDHLKTFQHSFVMS
jgi:hypothetical protein